MGHCVVRSTRFVTALRSEIVCVTSLGGQLENNASRSWMVEKKNKGAVERAVECMVGSREDGLEDWSSIGLPEQLACYSFVYGYSLCYFSYRTTSE